MIPNAHLFAQFTDNAYNKQQIIDFEKEILIALDWKVNFITISNWTNLITVRWDSFMNEINNYIQDISFCQFKFPKPYFRKNNANSYNFIRAFFQYLDMVILDYDYLKYTEKLLGLSLLYILLSNVMGNLDFSVLKQKMCFNSEDINNNNEFNVLFQRFLNSYWGIELSDLMEHIFYISFLIDSQFSINPPTLNQQQNSDEEKNVRKIFKH